MKKLNVFILIASLTICLGASAQSFRSGYFLDNYLYGYRINPAQINEQSFFGIILGNVESQNVSNIGISSILFPKGDHLVTGLNEAVSSEQFLGGLKPNNFVDLDESINLVAIGFADNNSMHTIELNARLVTTNNLPHSLFSLLKKGGTGTYDLGAFYSDSNLLTDFVYGYSTHIDNNFSIGGRIHFLIGVANVAVNANASTVSLSSQRIVINPNIDIHSSGILSIGKDEAGNLDLNQFNLYGSPVGGYGGALDFGLEYKSNFGLTATLSITDLGLISWSNNVSAKASGTFDYSGSTITLDGDGIHSDLLNITDKIQEAIQLRPGVNGSSLSMMPFNVTAGARYFMPFYDKLSVGLVGTYHNAKKASWFDTRLGATISPANIISLTGNVGIGSFGPVWGAAVNANLGPVNLVAGLDSMFGKMGKIKGIPVPIGRFMENAHVGITVTF